MSHALEALERALNVDEVLEALARALWERGRDGDGECPPDRIPTLEHFARHATHPATGAMDAASRLLDRFMSQVLGEAPDDYSALARRDAVSDGFNARWTMGFIRGSDGEPIAHYLPDKTPAADSRWANERFVPSLSVEHLYGGHLDAQDVHAMWIASDPDARPVHPLVPLVRSWKDRPRTIEFRHIIVAASARGRSLVRSPAVLDLASFGEIEARADFCFVSGGV